MRRHVFGPVAKLRVWATSHINLRVVRFSCVENCGFVSRLTFIQADYFQVVRMAFIFGAFLCKNNFEFVIAIDCPDKTIFIFEFSSFHLSVITNLNPPDYVEQMSGK